MSLNIYICEDDNIQRKMIEEIIEFKIDDDKETSEIVLSTGNPKEILDYKFTDNEFNLYFLDIEIKNSEINGFDLASKIRERDPMGYIVFVTTHSEMSILTFKYRIEALDFIIKDDIKEIERGICNCIDEVNKKIKNSCNNKNNYFKFKDITSKNNIIPYENILFFETIKHSSRKIKMVCLNKEIEFSYKIGELALKLGDDFFQCHRSIIANIKNVEQIDSSNGRLVFCNGQICEIGKKQIKELKKYIELKNK